MMQHGERRIAGWVVPTLLVCVACGGRPPAVAPVPAAAAEAVDVSVFLIGDAGEPKAGHEPVLVALEREIARRPERSIVVFLGDNLYPSGLPDSTHPKYREYARRLDDQVAVLRASGARGYFLPGNHDWEHGLTGVTRQARFLQERGAGLAFFLPQAGCPGPDVVEVGMTGQLVVLDTQWWFQRESDGTTTDSSVCAGRTMGQVTDSVRAILAAANDRHSIVVGHHPLESGGPHGGHFGWQWHIFPLRKLSPWLWIPLPVIGSVYPVSRKLGVKKQDLTSSVYRTFRDSLRSAFSGQPPLVYAAGHEHNLQVMQYGPSSYLVVSGAGIFRHANPAYWKDETLFAASAEGFVRLDLLKGGRVRLGVFVVASDGTGDEAFSTWLD